VSDKCFFFAGGGTGGHIYPGIAVAEHIRKKEPAAKIHFFCSERPIDSQVLSKAGFEFTQLPAAALSFWPRRFINFVKTFFQSSKIARLKIVECKNAVVIGIGGFAAGPVCHAAHKLKVPVALINVDIVPGKANKLIGRWADEIFVQFEETAEHFKKTKAAVSVVGCPLRRGFANPQPNKVIEQLGLAKDKKILLITGASSGSRNINTAVCSLLEKLTVFADDWQIVHLTGRADFEQVKQEYEGAKITAKVLEYCDDMPDLLAAAALVIGRSGAVSIAEYAAASVPSICMPYPYHRDMHQYFNAGKLVEAGAAIIVDDLPDAKDKVEWLWEELKPLMEDEKKRQEMKQNCATVAKVDAASKIAEKLLKD